MTPLRLARDIATGAPIDRERLRALEEEALVLRRSYSEAPPRVEYELTDKGRALLGVIDAMRQFGHDWLHCDHDHFKDMGAGI